MFDLYNKKSFWHHGVCLSMTSGVAALRQTSTRRYKNNQAERKARAKRSRPLNRLGELPLFRSLVFFRVYCLIVFSLS